MAEQLGTKVPGTSRFVGRPHVIRPSPLQQISATLVGMTSMELAQRSRSARRTQAHACPSCRRPWSLRGARHPNGVWILLCSSCDWRRVVSLHARSSRSG